jgi:hypothetical protein
LPVPIDLFIPKDPLLFFEVERLQVKEKTGSRAQHEPLLIATRPTDYKTQKNILELPVVLIPFSNIS